MSVAVEPSSGAGLGRCVLCHRVTTLKWNGCAPLCEGCARNAWDGLLVKIARREHLTSQAGRVAPS